jgi:hypothetical protein
VLTIFSRLTLFSLLSKGFIMKCTVISLFMISIVFTSVFAQQGTKDQAITIVTKAAEFLKTNGKETGIIELNNPKGKFCEGDLYVFAYDTTGTMIAHPKNSKLIGVNLMEIPDVDGKLFRKDIVILARSAGKGWVDYKYKNPTTSAIESKTTYVLRNGDMILCCGIYKND